MIIARSPLRISLGGGGTDLPSYYERFGGFLITAAIDKYVYITLHETFIPELIIRWPLQLQDDAVVLARLLLPTCYRPASVLAHDPIKPRNHPEAFHNGVHTGPTDRATDPHGHLQHRLHRTTLHSFKMTR